jgi:hypothetical protein
MARTWGFIHICNKLRFLFWAQNHKTRSGSRFHILDFFEILYNLDTLYQLMREHISILRQQDLATGRPPILMDAKDGTVVEVFEWKSELAIEQAHSNPVILKMGEGFAEACEYLPVGKVEEALNLFSQFKPLNLI